MSFQLNKVKQKIHLFLDANDALDGFVFLNAQTDEHHGTQRVLDLLSEDGNYFPFLREDGGVSIISKFAVRKVMVPAHFELENERSYGGVPGELRHITVHLQDGTTEKGELLVEDRIGEQRTQDALNAAGTYVTLRQGSQVALLPATRIISVEEDA